MKAMGEMISNVKHSERFLTGQENLGKSWGVLPGIYGKVGLLCVQRGGQNTRVALKGGRQREAIGEKELPMSDITPVS